MQIYIKTLTNTISLHVDSTYSISKIKKILRDREGIPITEQRLLFSGKQLEDKKTVAYYAIQRESTLYLMKRLRGGAAGLIVEFTNISATIATDGIITVTATGTYTLGPPTVNSFILAQRDTENVALAYLTRSITAVAGNFTITYTLNNTDIQFYNYNFIIYALADTSKCTLVLRRYLFVPGSARNIIMTGNNSKSITTVDISTESKSVILPPITTLGELARGVILHFKIIDYTSPNILQIMPYFSGEVPTVYTLYETLPTFDSTIDFNTDPVVTSPIFKLDSINSVISLISNGSTDWKILNYYTDSLSITVQNAAEALPVSRVEITSQNVILYYTDSIATICIFPSTQSYYAIRYLTILNSTASNVTYTIYFSQYESVDGVPSIGNGWCKTSITVNTTSIGSIMFVRTPSGYLILGTASYAGVTVNNTTRDETPYTLLSKNISFVPPEVPAEDVNYEVPATAAATGTSKLCILKGRRNSAPDLTRNIYTPHGSTSSKIIFNGNNNTRITFTQLYSSALWLSVFYTSTTNILPINYYTGIGPTFFTYLDVSGTTGGDPAPGPE